MTDTAVRIERVASSLRITLDSQSNRNALSRALLQGVHDALDLAELSARAVVIDAVGPAFCAGADLKERTSGDASPPPPDLFERLATFPLPVIVVVDGAARAGGLGIVATADIALGTERASFAVSEVHRGLVPAMISVHLGRICTMRSLQRYFLTGEPFGAEEAVQMGLLTERVDDPDARVAALLESLERGGPGALEQTKSILGEIGSRPWRDRIDDMAQLSAGAFASAEGQEGMTAFLERRQPSWVPTATPDPRPHEG